MVCHVILDGIRPEFFQTVICLFQCILEKIKQLINPYVTGVMAYTWLIMLVVLMYVDQMNYRHDARPCSVNFISLLY